eukprot:1161499-Pelagomonas_calceolata.AAC.2
MRSGCRAAADGGAGGVEFGCGVAGASCKAAGADEGLEAECRSAAWGRGCPGWVAVVAAGASVTKAQSVIVSLAERCAAAVEAVSWQGRMSETEGREGE